MIEGIRGTGVIEFANIQKPVPLHVLVKSTKDFAFWRPGQIFRALIRERVGGRGQ
jgi:hypothetical protein